MFDPDLMDHAIKEILELAPDLVVVAGDLTSEGYQPQFRQAKRYLDRLDSLEMLVIPGNHDLMNVGFLHFRDAFGKSDRVMRLPFSSPGSDTPHRYATIVSVNSSKPDLAEGEVGHTRYDWIRQSFEWPDDYRIFVMHHHLVSVPGTGRERNIVWDAGDMLALLTELKVSLVLCGHKHVPNVWQVGEMLLINSGTATSYRVRGYTRPSYNVVEIYTAERSGSGSVPPVPGENVNRVRIVQRYPGVGELVMANYYTDERKLDLNPQLAGMFNRGAWKV
jgi:3',5'-cyclic-AMP phosphodiesterase